MFTGLIEAVGKVGRVSARAGNRLFTIGAGFAPELGIGDSVAVNGTCLTVVEKDAKAFTVEAMGATLAATTLDALKAGGLVNLERALALGDRLGGHMVQGHVDEVGTVRRVERHSGYWTVAVEVNRASAKMVVPKGSICIDGISLTVATCRPGEFSVNVIPHTWENTNLRQRRAGQRVNVEYDMLVKAVQQQLGAQTR